MPFNTHTLSLSCTCNHRLVLHLSPTHFFLVLVFFLSLTYSAPFLHSISTHADKCMSIPHTHTLVLLMCFIADEGRYQISVDQVTVNNNITCPLIAVSYMFSLFYVLNIMYPKGAALSLEFIQRYVVIILKCI